MQIAIRPMNNKHYMFIKVKELVGLSQNIWKWLNQTFFFNEAEISYFYTSQINWSNTIVLFWYTIWRNLKL